MSIPMKQHSSLRHHFKFISGDLRIEEINLYQCHGACCKPHKDVQRCQKVLGAKIGKSEGGQTIVTSLLGSCDKCIFVVTCFSVMQCCTERAVSMQMIERATRA